jgi:hypothetical protein
MDDMKLKRENLFLIIVIAATLVIIEIARLIIPQP